MKDIIDIIREYERRLNVLKDGIDKAYARAYAAEKELEDLKESLEPKLPFPDFEIREGTQTFTGPVWVKDGKDE